MSPSRYMSKMRLAVQHPLEFQNATELHFSTTPDQTPPVPTEWPSATVESYTYSVPPAPPTSSHAFEINDPSNPQEAYALAEALSTFPIPPPKRSSRAPRRIPRPRNAFMLFRCTFSASSFMRTSTEHDNRHITRIIAHCWNALPERQKAYWYRRALEEKQRHAELYPGYRFTPTSRANRQKRNVKRNGDADKERSKRIAELLLSGKHGDELDVAVKQDDVVHSDSDGSSYRSDSPEDNVASTSTRPAKAPRARKARRAPQSRAVASSSTSSEALSLPRVTVDTAPTDLWDVYPTASSSIYAPQASYPSMMLPHTLPYPSHSPALSSGSAHSYTSSSSPSHQVAQITEQFAYTSVATPPHARAPEYYPAGAYDAQERHPSPHDAYPLAYPPPLAQDYLGAQDTYGRGLHFQYTTPSGYSTSYPADYQPGFTGPAQQQGQPSGEYYPEYSDY